MKILKIGMAQIYPLLGDLEANLRKHLEMIEEAIARGADLIVFPELLSYRVCAPGSDV